MTTDSDFTKPAHFNSTDDEDINSADEDINSDDDWEEVEEAKVPTLEGEADFLSRLLNNENEEVDEEKDLSKRNIVISVSTNGGAGKNKTPRDPKVLAALLLSKQMKERYYAFHTMHTIGLLTYARFTNRACDDDLLRCLGLSLLSNVKEVWTKPDTLLPIEKWKVNHLRFVALSFTSCGSSTTNKQLLSSLPTRLEKGTSSLNDLTILMVAALRTIGFDTRLVVALNPMPLKPGTPTPQTKGKIKTLKPLKYQTNNDKILSSSESESEVIHLSSYTIFMEIYLPISQSWVSVDLQPPVGRVELEAFQLPCHYVVGFSSTIKCGPIEPYLGRSPCDLAPRYNPSWMGLTSRTTRLPDPLWSSLLSGIKSFCDADASHYLREQDLAKEPELRDAADSVVIFNKLRLSPLPTRVQELKNHPLYALKRHLLKFEVIYPEDAMVIGFLKVGKSEYDTEAIFPRDCVYLCHTRESWLKEAKTVRIGEKPAKVVNARMSLKRKLLQDANGPTPTVDVYGPWQVEDYVPPVAMNGKVPRNEHGNVELFKACMLPVGCVHIRLPGIHHIAKQLGIDAAPAMIGWTFHGAGWAHPEYDGYVVCKEQVPILVDAWRAQQMNVAKAEAADRAERALANWRRLTRHLLLWQRVEAQFQLAKSATSSQGASNKMEPTLAVKGAKTKPVGSGLRGKHPAVVHQAKQTPVRLDEGWQRFAVAADHLPTFPSLLEVKAKKKKKTVKEPVAKPKVLLPKQTQSAGNMKKRKRRRKMSTSSSSSDSNAEGEYSE